VQRISPGDEFLDEGVRGVPVNAAGNAMQKRNSIRFGTLTEAVDVGLCECASEEDRDRGGSTTTSATPAGSSSPRFRGR